MQTQALKRQLAEMQAHSAAVSPQSADCIFDGMKGCMAVPLIELAPGTLPIPADAARFLKTIPPTVQERPDVKPKIEAYEHMAGVRGKFQNHVIADIAVSQANPTDLRARQRLDADTAQLKIAVRDEHELKKPLLNFTGPGTINLVPGPDNGSSH